MDRCKEIGAANGDSSSQSEALAREMNGEVTNEQGNTEGLYF